MPTAADYLRFLPEIILTLAGTLLMVMDAIAERRGSPLYGNITIGALIAAIAASVAAYSNPGPAFSDMLLVDGFATFFRILVISVGILAVLSSYRYISRENAEPGEYHALILFSVMGQCVMVTANELIMIFIGLEISSIATYVLAGYLRDDKRNNEAALKYFLLGSFATAFFLYGVALIYGMTGSTNLSLIRTRGGLSLAGIRRHLRRSHAGGTALQSFRRALPGLGARCLSGCSHTSFGFHVRGTQSCGIRNPVAHLHDRFRFDRFGMGAAGVDLRSALHDHRQLCRAIAVQHQATAGL